MRLGLGLGIDKHRILASGSGFDADYQAVLDYATGQGYTLPSPGQQTIQNQLVLDLKEDSLWGQLDSLFVMATDGNSDFALIDWIRLTTATAVNSPTFTADVGWSGNGTTSYINSGLIISSILGTSSYQQNDASTFVYQTWNGAQTDAAPYGFRWEVNDPKTRNQLRIRTADYRPSINDLRPIIAADYTANNWHHQKRTDATGFTTYTGATSFVNTIASTDPSQMNGDMFLLGINLYSGSNSLFSPFSGSIQVFGLGGAMDNANLKTAIDDYINSI